ncbi:MAG TPA: hypothetical protein H9684_01260 [Firmicutes bacterium]|nr:hypothetical protein [Bacillota bacterium]
MKETEKTEGIGGQGNRPPENGSKAARPSTILAVTVIGGTVLLLALLLFLILRPQEAEAEPPASAGPNSGAASAATSAQTPMLCVLGEWEGKLAVFSPNGISPDEVYDVYISTLPEEEQRRLEEGIPVYDEKTLAGLLEDYTS